MLEAVQFEEVTQVKLSRYQLKPPFCASVYLVDGLLVDTGPSHTASELVGFLSDKPPRLVVNTHHHEDHVGANHLLKKEFGVEIMAHPLAIDKIKSEARLYPYQEDVWGYPTPSEAKPIGDSVDTEHLHFMVIHTPGHDRDHICLFEPGHGWLFSGDLFVTTQPRVARPQEDSWQIIADLKTVRELCPRVMFTTPREDIITDPVALLDRTIDYLEKLGEEVVRLHRQGCPPEEIRQRIFGEESALAAPTQLQFSSLNLIKSFLKKGN